MSTTTTKNVPARVVSEVSGYITVRQAANMAGREQSTINYWLREGYVDGVYLDESVLLVEKSSLEAYLEELPRIEAEREERRQRSEELKRQEQEFKAQQARQREELKRQKEELKRMREASRRR